MLIEKTGYTAFTPDVLTWIQREGITDVYVCGLDTESCVMATMLGAFENGLTPWLIKDATASHAGSHVHEAGLLVIGRNVGIQHLITAGEVEFWQADRDRRHLRLRFGREDGGWPPRGECVAAGRNVSGTRG